MLLYIPIALSIIFGVGFLYSLNRSYRLKLEMRFLRLVAEEDKEARLKLEAEKLLSIQQVEELSSK